MRKLLILMLVLGFASSASAVLISSTQSYYFNMEITAPSATITTGDTVSIEIFAGDTVAVTDMLSTVLNISTAASIGSITQSIPGDWSAYLATTSVAGGGYNVNVNGVLPAAIALDDSIYSFSFVAGAAGVVTIDAVSGTWSGNVAVVGSADGAHDGVTPAYEIYGLPYATITVIPEPMTIALLGLGGLFLRRRKKVA